MSSYERSVELVEKLEAAGILRREIRGALLLRACSLLLPIARWISLAAIRPHGTSGYSCPDPVNADAHKKLDELADAVTAELPIVRATFASYVLSPDAPPLPAYRIAIRRRDLGMAIVESRLKDGELTLGTTPFDFSCQVTNARINSSYDDDGDAVETLCGDQIAPGRKLGSRALAGTFIQDWTAPAASSITDYCYTTISKRWPSRTSRTRQARLSREHCGSRYPRRRTAGT